MVIILLLVILNVFLLSQNIRLKKLGHSPNDHSHPNHDHVQESLYNRIVLDSKISEQFFLDKNAVCRDSLDKKIPIRSLVQDSVDYLVFRFSPSQHCSSCIEATLPQLKKIALSSNLRLLLFATEIIPRDIYVLNRKYNHNFKIYSIDNKYFQSDLEHYKLPYLFTIDRNLKAKNVFFVEYDLTFLTERYLSMIEKIIRK